jgi:predicted metal-dependent phosphoesterase TrpH
MPCIDLHIHTRYSRDSVAPVPSLIDRCRKNGLGPIAITDHHTIQGALEVERAAPFQVIVGEEITSTAGNIIGLFLLRPVTGGLSPMETVAQIKDQGGLVLIPHPFDRFRPSALEHSALLEILPFIDLMEGYNSHSFFPIDNYKGVAFAREHSLPVVAGSGAHSAVELGNTYTEVPEFDFTPQGLLKAVSQGQMGGCSPNPLWLMAPGYARLRKVLR